jgi:hypothetical protein
VAAVAISDKKFLHPGGVSGFGVIRRSEGCGRCRARKGLWPREEEGPDKQVPHVSDGERGKKVPFRAG